MNKPSRPSQFESASAFKMFPILFCLLFMLTFSKQLRAGESYALSFSTCVGGSKWDYARDVCADAQGNIYLVGATASSDFPTTPGAYQRVQDKTGTHVGNYGHCDAFVAKFSPTGNLIWSTYLGGPNYDRAYAVEVDSKGYVYVAGRAGMGFPTTAHTFQPTFKGVDQGGYGWENAFVAKLSPDGSNLVWASYVGLGEMCRDMAIDANGDIYLPLVRNTGAFVPPGTNYTLATAWFANAYQKTLKGGSEIGVIKVSNDGTHVLWATWLGGSSNENTAVSIRADAAGCVYVFTETSSTDIPTTPGAWRQTRPGGRDGYAAKLSPDGSQLIYGTYIGGSGDDFVPSTHNLAVDAQGNAYFGGSYRSTDIPTTLGVVQPAHAGGDSDVAIIKLTPTGSLSRCTYIGGKGDDGSDGIYADSAGNVFIKTPLWCGCRQISVRFSTPPTWAGPIGTLALQDFLARIEACIW